MTSDVLSLARRTVVAGTVTAVYFLPEIIDHADSVTVAFIAYFIQVFHDSIYIYYPLMCHKAFKHPASHEFFMMNIIHSILLVLFCVYKRCVLTLYYNSLLGLDPCQRYTPNWQRVVNYYLSLSKHCHVEEWRNTYIWLDNHIIQTVLVGIVNLRAWLYYKRKPKSY